PATSFSSAPAANASRTSASTSATAASSTPRRRARPSASAAWTTATGRRASSAPDVPTCCPEHHGAHRLRRSRVPSEETCMRSRPLGRSGLTVQPLALGTNVFGWSLDEAGAFRVLDAFVDAGLDLVDTADMYPEWVPGNQGGESEAMIG